MTRTMLLIATLSSGLVAGLFAAFSYAVMPGLRRADDAAFVSAMRGINHAILNPVFGVLFAGALIASGAAAFLARDLPDVRVWVLVGAGFYVLTLVITMAVNVPLNDALRDGSGSAAHLRAQFENTWTAWNVVRAVTSCCAFASLAVAFGRL
ncbi:hypothetical protein ASD11_16705 [Aeromicrobium sp. Root495]|uniref:anthrone oxygenase family protein n=1 Tax=Aeromicrobium sp. Root495 TaxID=1736550 RepID=UPI0006F3EFFC|nr:anthrone oxygenase family protein [Aeromicrobium sp. Root495]KQY56103.1 hypothetical protein ASD11_16705 [Aeromicrobium sp. Root495]